MRYLVLVLFLSFGFTLTFAQEVERRKGEVLIQLANQTPVQDFLRKAQASRQAPSLDLARTLSVRANMHLVRFDEDNWSLTEVISHLQQQERLIHVQANRKASPRRVPNDDQYNQQETLPLIQAPEAWDITTGGETAEGTEIVVAVLDGGVDLEHEDLAENIWTNEAEVPDDGIDNDQNGFVDDYVGWNPRNQNDNHPAESHGTSVTGIIGAKGDNSAGISGVNWNIKIMPFSGVNFEDEIVEALMYAYEMRRLFNESNGEEGAFVVVTNYSLGIDFAPCANFDLWNAAYDSLGTVGVLNAGATTNTDTNVDEFGDVPSTCESEFLIAVTNTNLDDEKVQRAGFGSIHVDLGAPGDGTLTTRPNNEYRTFPGTSAATPHVAGAVALLYSVPCGGLLDDAINDPVNTARQMKQYILEGVDPNPTLEGITVSGGRLNLFNSLQMVLEDYGAPIGDLVITEASPNPTTDFITFFLTRQLTESYQFEVFNASGHVMYRDLIGPECLGRYTLEVYDWPAGVYYVQIASDNEVDSVSFVRYFD